MDFDNKTALITGSGAIGGLGHATARLLLEGGASVVLTGRDCQRGEEVVADLRTMGGSVRFIEADLANIDDVRRLAEEAGPVNILVNNAAIVPWLATSDQDVASFDAAFAINVRAPYFLTARIAPKMAANGGGSIVNISTTAAVGIGGLSVYGATKAAMESLARTWTAEFAASKVRINTVAPGPMLTAATIAALGPDAGGMGRTTAMGRAADPCEVAQVVAFLASDRSSFLSGAIIAADGGRTAI